MIIKIRHFQRADIKDYHTSEKVIILNVRETKCIYRLWNRPFNYYIAKWKDYIDDEKFVGNESQLNNKRYWKFLKDMGELKVETCKSKTFTIK